MKVESLVVGQLQTNCYLVWCEKTSQCLIIDPGDDAGFIINKIKDLVLKPAGIIATHSHFDHVLAAEELRLAFNILLMLHRLDLCIMKSVKKGLVPKVDRFLKEGDWIKFGKEKLKVIETPGHTPGSISLYSQKDNLIFVGDLIFAYGGVGRTDFSYASQERLEESIEKILKLPDKTIVYPGHGEQTTIKNARDYYLIIAEYREGE